MVNDDASSTSDEYLGNGWGRLFDELKAKEGLTSDAALARALGVTPPFLSAVRKHRKGVSVDLGQAIYKRLGRDMTLETLQMFVPRRVKAHSSLIHLQEISILIRGAVVARAAGKCELCRRSAPFLAPNGIPYLEMHHVVSRASGGEDSTRNLVALCPNCHRKMHLSPLKKDIDRLISRAALSAGS